MLIQQEDYQAAADWADRAATAPGAHYLIAMIALAANGLADATTRRPAGGGRYAGSSPMPLRADYFAAFPTRHSASRTRIATELRRQGF